MRIGVIADTHIPRAQKELPAAVGRVFAGVDIILHAGDICTLDVLRSLQNSFALTMAVHGESDDADVRRYLDPQQTVEFANRRIGLIHGDQAVSGQWWRRILMSRDRLDASLRQGLQEVFSDVHCIVYGHTHRPYVKMHGDVLLFNPGPAAPVDGQRPSVGILDIGEHSIIGRIIYLDEV